MAYEITVNGTVLPTPKASGGLVETYEDVWSANTGRDATGEMVGTLVATKAKLSIEWNALSFAEAAVILSAIYNKGFVTLSFPSLDGTTHTIAGYFGSPAFTQYSWADGMRWATGISVDFIEK